MKKIFLLTLLIASAISLFAQQQDANKFQKPDESGYIKVDKAPETIKPPAPVYPPEARIQAIEGKVFLKILIDEQGNVIQEKIERSVNALLDNSALEAVKSAKFSPALVKNKPVKVWVTLPISFKLNVNESDKDPDINDFIKVEVLPEMINPVTPVYPEELKKNNIEGKVYIKLFLDKEGNPKKAVVMKSDNELFNKSAIDAAMQSKFTPAKIKNEPIAIWIVLPYRFLNEKHRNEYATKNISVEEIEKQFREANQKIEDDAWQKQIGAQEYKWEKLNLDIKYGDESVIYKTSAKNWPEKYYFFARKDKTIYRYQGESIEQIRGYVDALNSTQNSK